MSTDVACGRLGCELRLAAEARRLCGTKASLSKLGGQWALCGNTLKARSQSEDRANHSLRRGPSAFETQSRAFVLPTYESGTNHDIRVVPGAGCAGGLSFVLGSNSRLGNAQCRPAYVGSSVYGIVLYQ